MWWGVAVNRGQTAHLNTPTLKRPFSQESKDPWKFHWNSRLPLELATLEAGWGRICFLVVGEPSGEPLDCPVTIQNENTLSKVNDIYANELNLHHLKQSQTPAWFDVESASPGYRILMFFSIQFVQPRREGGKGIKGHPFLPRG